MAGAALASAMTADAARSVLIIIFSYPFPVLGGRTFLRRKRNMGTGKGRAIECFSPVFAWSSKAFGRGGGGREEGRPDTQVIDAMDGTRPSALLIAALRPWASPWGGMQRHLEGNVLAVDRPYAGNARPR